MTPLPLEERLFGRCRDCTAALWRRGHSAVDSRVDGSKKHEAAHTPAHSCVSWPRPHRGKKRRRRWKRG
jgi:hypothetical protein